VVDFGALRAARAGWNVSRSQSFTWLGW